MEENRIAEATGEQSQEDQEPLNKRGSVSTASSSPPTSSSSSGCFDCNICLDFAVDPVVTLCGHLYCWPCIYRWLQVDPSSQCPVCKSSLSKNALVPLYGRGHTTTPRSRHGIEIPHRPSSRHPDQAAPESGISRSAGEEDLDPHDRHRHQHYHLHQHEHHHHYPLGDHLSSARPSSPALGSTRMVHSTAGGVLGGMAIAVLPWVLRNHQEAMSMHYSSPLSVGANGNSPRLQRQEMEMEVSLHRIWLFLFCCAVLCLLLF